MSSDRPIPNSYWLEEGRLLAGEYPRNRDEESSRAKLRRLLEAGITLFLDLTEEGEGLEPYVVLAEEVAGELGRPEEHQRIAIRDLDTPTEATMTEILDVIDAALAEQQVVYLHCWGGIGRTGTVAGCYLVRRGMSGAEALERIRRLRAGTPDGWKRSPETGAQREMVLGWGRYGDS